MKERLISTQEVAYEYPYPTMDMYVHGLKNSLKQDGNGGKTLESWLSTISLMSPDEHREVKARIQTKQGRGPVYELSSSHELPEVFSEDTPATAILEANGLVRAKLELIKGMDNVPWGVKMEASRVIKKAEKEASLVLDKSIKRGLPNKQTKLSDIFEGVKINRRKLLTSVLPTLALVACSPVMAKPMEPSPVGTGGNISPTVEVTDIPISTPEPTKIPTPEVSPTPEIFAADPTNIDSWPEKFKNFYINNPEDQSMDNDFQTFMDISRRDYLKKAGIEGAENMNSDELLWQMIKQSANEKKELMITPLEIVDIVTDPEVKDIVWRNHNGIYGSWDLFMNDTILLPKIKNLEYKTSVYGRDVVVPRWGFNGRTVGDYLSFIKLPGEESYAALIQMKDYDQNRHFAIIQFYNDEVESNRYNAIVSGTYGDGPAISAEATFSEPMGWKWKTYQGLKDMLIPYLQWPPRLISISSFSMAPREYHGEENGSLSVVVVDKKSGLEIGRIIQQDYVTLPQETEALR